MTKIIAVGKIKNQSIKTALADYHKRLSRFSKVEIKELPDQPEGKDVGIAIKKESEAIISAIKVDDFVILLDLDGQTVDSIALAEQVEKWQTKNICFVIGGSNGVDETVRERADYLWKLSELTFPHQLVRLLLAEQLYRAYMIINKRSYHK